MHNLAQRQTRPHRPLFSWQRMMIASLLALCCSSAVAGSSFQQRLLFSPAPGILLAEANGRIMIYDGLTSQDVDKAMDTQFDRIENMMFIRTRLPQEDGSYVVTDDECD